MKQEYRDRLEEAELILVGIGTEFEENKFCKSADAISAMEELSTILEGKNYFVITTCTNDILKNIGLAEDRIVSPCGNLQKKQCPNHCENSLVDLTKEDILEVENALKSKMEPRLGICSQCGAEYVLNNVYAKVYDEAGYLDAWSIYTKWLQGTLNKKLCILELGVNLSFPSIIRWPFEKVAFYNQKAVFVRVNEKLYHMSEELKDKGISIEQNAIDWVLDKDI